MLILEWKKVMEFQRFAQIAELEKKGWLQDLVCQALQKDDQVPGGPTYMRAPTGRYFKVGVGRENIIPSDDPKFIEIVAKLEKATIKSERDDFQKAKKSLEQDMSRKPWFAGVETGRNRTIVIKCSQDLGLEKVMFNDGYQGYAVKFKMVK